MPRKRKLTAAAFGRALSTAGWRVPPAAPAAPVGPRVLVVDRWNGSEWVQVRLVWNGTQYAEVA